MAAPGIPQVSAVDAGIHCLAIPTPFPIGPINAYLLEGSPLTLVDAGPNSAVALLSLEAQLAALGHAVEDIDLVVITHQHSDHTGLVEAVVARSGAQTACLDLLAPYLEDFEAASIADDAHAAALMVRYGVDATLVTGLAFADLLVRGWGTSIAIDRRLADGELLELGDRTLRVRHVPGHSPSDTMLVDDAHGVALAGDHLLARVSSNAALSRPLDADAGPERPRSLLTYRASLRATRTLDVGLVLGGHGLPIEDHRALIDFRLQEQDERAETLLGMLADGPATAPELGARIWGDLAITQAFMVVSEVVGHLDLLIADGRVRELTQDPVIRFQSI
jgi:glyoxylase-like metal-dependent hydrolase (beta-lactamase superfamily II)